MAPAGPIYVTYLPRLAANLDRVSQIAALGAHMGAVYLFHNHPEPDAPVAAAANVRFQPLFDAPRPGVAAVGALRRRLMALMAEDGERALIVDDWYGFLAPLFPWLRLARRRRGARLLLLASPVTSHLLWFGGNTLATLWRCRDFSRVRAWRLPTELWMLVTADAVAVQSSALRARYRRMLPTKPLLVVSNAVTAPEDAATPGPLPASGPRLVYVGNLSLNKGLDLILDLARTVPHPITVVGNGARAEGRRIEAALAASRIRHVPRLSRADLDRLYAESDLLLLPSRHEGMPRVVLEFLALDKPVVASDLPGLADLATPLLHRCRPGDAADFARRVADALARPPSAAERAANRDRLAAFTPTATAAAKATALAALYPDLGLSA